MGVIVIPQEDAASIIDGAEAYAAMDAGKVEEAKNGTSKRQWVEDTLAKKNVRLSTGHTKAERSGSKGGKRINENGFMQQKPDHLRSERKYTTAALGIHWIFPGPNGRKDLEGVHTLNGCF